MSLQIKLDASVIRPGELLKGLVAWDFDSVPNEIELEVSWQTSGKGTDDSDIAFEENWSPDSKSGERSFEFQMPRGPISVQGNLISIGWQVKCTSERPAATCSRPFVLSQLDRPVRLSPLSIGDK
jgi:hypothetical protein